jgi:pimeloyl-ACP methyl ester carboxylesterase
MTRLCTLLLLALVGVVAGAQEAFIQIDLGRSEARLPVYVLRNPQAVATLILLPGGDAGPGKIVDGKPTSGNFLSRSRELFHAQDFNVLVVYRPSDLSELEYGYRLSQQHLGELEKVITYARHELGKPIWLVATSRGTVSATAAAIALGDGGMQGLVLTSSVTSRKVGAIGSQNIAAIKVPTLVVHHKNDSCPICIPHEAGRIAADLKSAPVRKFVLVEGGSDPVGDPCGARHWHGFINHEKETVKTIADWIKHPQG